MNSIHMCVCASCLIPQDGPGNGDPGRALPVLYPPVGGLLPSRRCIVSRASSYFPLWTRVWGTRPRGFGMGLWIISSAPAAQLPCWQPLQNRDPRRTSQLHPALLVTPVLWHLLGGYSWTWGVCQVPSSCSPEQGCPAGCVCLQRGGWRRDLIRTSSQRGGPGDPIRPPECGGNYRDHGEGFCLSEGAEGRGEGAGGPHKVRNLSSWATPPKKRLFPYNPWTMGLLIV